MAIIIQGLGKALPFKEMKNGFGATPESVRAGLPEKTKRAHRWRIKHVWKR